MKIALGTWIAICVVLGLVGSWRHVLIGGLVGFVLGIATLSAGLLGMVPGTILGGILGIAARRKQKPPMLGM